MRPLLAVLIASVSWAQDGIPQQPAFRSQSNVVLVPALVKDKSGSLVYGLKAQDFVIEDEGFEQVAQLDETPEMQPVSLVIAIQTGRRAAREFGRMRGLASVLDPIVSQSNVETSILFFDSQTKADLNFTRDSELITQHLKTLPSGDGGAAVLDAVDVSVKLLSQRPEPRRRVLLLISETRDHGSRSQSGINGVIAHIGESNVAIYALAFSPSKSQVLDTMRGTNRDEGRATADILAPMIMAANAIKKNIPQTIASMTGGEYELFETRKSFEGRITTFNNHLYNRYLLSFQPKNPRPGLHRIAVDLKSAEKGAVIARRNYWASAGPDAPTTAR